LDPILKNLDFFAEGYWATIRLSVGAMAAALVLGSVVATLRVWGGRIGSMVGGAYVEFFRNTPLLVQLFFYAVVLAPANLGITRDPFIVALVGLSIYTAAYVSEVVRSGILSVDQRQIEAARSLALSQVQALRRVVLPQAIRTVIPPLGNLALALVRNTALASAIGATELLQVGNIVTSRTFRVEPLIAVVLGYLSLTIPLAILISRLERRLRFAR
jgi:putative glutamine transport system permease protein